MADMLIKNGSVVFETEVKKADILVRNGKIAGQFSLRENTPETVRFWTYPDFTCSPAVLTPICTWTTT